MEKKINSNDSAEKKWIDTLLQLGQSYFKIKAYNN